MPPKAPRQLPPAPPRSASLIIEVGNLWRWTGHLIDTFIGRGLTDVDEAGSHAFQEYGTTFTVASGVISLTIVGHGGQDTAAISSITVDTEGAAASDDLDTINGGREGMILFVRALNTARTVVLKDLTGNLSLGADITLDTNTKFALLKYSSVLSMWIHQSGTSTGGSSFSILTNGDPINPELIFDSNGDVIVTFVP